MIPYGSLFSGAGLLDLGLERAISSLRCAWSVEIDADRRAIHAAHFPDAEQHADVTTVDPLALAPVAGIVGGVPCNTHSTSNTAGERGLAPEWTHAKRIVDSLAPEWCVWESSAKDQSWRHWVPAVRRDMWTLGHSSVCIHLQTASGGASHERDRAIVFSWRASSDADKESERARAVHAEVASLQARPVLLWDGRVPPGAVRRLADGLDVRLACAVGLGVDQRTAADAARILGALIRAL